MTKNAEQARDRSVLPERIGEVGILFGMKDWFEQTVRAQKKKGLLECFGFNNPKIDHVEAYKHDQIHKFLMDLENLVVDGKVTTARLIPRDDKTANTGTVVCHITEGVDELNDAIRRTTDSGPLFMFNLEGVSTADRLKKIALGDAHEGWIYSRPHSDEIELSGFQNRREDEIVRTNAGGGIRMQMGRIEKVNGKTYVTFDLKSAFGDASIRRTSPNIDREATPNDQEPFYDPNKFPALTTSVTLLYENGRFSWPKELNGNHKTSISKAVKEKSAGHFVESVIKRLTELDGESLAMLFRTMYEINPNPNTLSAEVLFYYINGELTVKVIDFDGVMEDKDNLDNPNKFLLWFENYKLQAAKGNGTGVWPDVNKDIDVWLNNPRRRKTIRDFEREFPSIMQLVSSGYSDEEKARRLSEYDLARKLEVSRPILVDRTFGYAAAREDFYKRGYPIQKDQGEEKRRIENFVDYNLRPSLINLLTRRFHHQPDVIGPKYFGSNNIAGDVESIYDSIKSHFLTIDVDTMPIMDFTHETTMPVYMARLLHTQMMTLKEKGGEEQVLVDRQNSDRSHNAQTRAHNEYVAKNSHLIYEIEEGEDLTFWPVIEEDHMVKSTLVKTKVWEDTDDENIKIYSHDDEKGNITLIRVATYYGAELVYCFDNYRLINPDVLDVKQANEIFSRIQGYPVIQAQINTASREGD